MSLSSCWLRPDHNNRSRGTGVLLSAHLLAMIRYGPRRLATATRVGFTGWRPLTTSHILQALYLELGLLGPIWKPSMIRSMHWMSRCRGSLRRPTGGTWSYTNTMRETHSSGGSSYSLWSRGWRLCTKFTSRCGAAFRHPLHHFRPRLHHLHLHLHCLTLVHTATPLESETRTKTTTMASWILTMISICWFYIFFV